MKLKHFFTQPRSTELTDELKFHFEQLVQQKLRAGMSEDEARRQARVEFGSLETAMEDTAAQYPGWWIEVLKQDVRYGLRGLRRNLVFATASVLTLALGIGATTAVFSVIDRILFRSLPYAHDDRLVSVGLVAPIMPQEFMLGNSYYVWKETQTPFEAFTSWSGVVRCDLSEVNPEHLACANVEADFLPTLGIGLVRGRNFLPEEDVPNAPRVALISYGFWKSRFGKAEDVLEKTILIDGDPTRIIGILPPTFELPTLEHAEIVVPQRVDQAMQRRPGVTHIMNAIGRLKPAVTAAQAVSMLQPQFDQALSLAPPRFRAEVRLRVRSLRDFQVHDARLTAWVLLGAVFAVLLIAGANVSGLLLARAAERGMEFAIRKSLGANRWRLLSQVLTEALLLSSLGVLAGCVIGEALLRVFVRVAPLGIPYIDQAHLDSRVLGFAIAISLASGLAFGSAPFWSRDLLGRRVFRPISGASRARARQVILVAELSLTLMLLSAAALLLRTARNLQNQDLGIRTGQVVTATVHFSRQTYPNAIKRMQFVNLVEERLKQIPGVSAVAVSDSVPPGGLQHDRILGAIAIEGRPKPEGGTGGKVVWRWVTPPYFEILGIGLLRGSGFGEEQRQSNDHFIIVSQALAARFFPGEDPIGKRLDLNEAPTSNPWYTVLGVAANVKNGGLATENEPEYYKLWRNRPEDWNTGFAGPDGGFVANFILSTAANPNALASLIRSEVASVDNSIPVEFQTMRQHVSSLAERPRFEAALLTLFAALAIVLAAIGLYGLLAFIVSRRTQEIAVRMALGAGKQDIVALIGRDGLKMIGVGVLLGALGALSISRCFRALLFGVNTNDLFSLTSAIALLVAVGVIAMWVPLRRAMSVDPMQALRHE
ncbi:MAG TPA: ABC transporter permease [Terriglobales bacterium]|nr:ABC transporter permease [Terriglobales bacterium]